MNIHIFQVRMGQDSLESQAILVSTMFELQRALTIVRFVEERTQAVAGTPSLPHPVFFWAAGQKLGGSATPNRAKKKS
jgi:hypothetical protein